MIQDLNEFHSDDEFESIIASLLQWSWDESRVSLNFSLKLGKKQNLFQSDTVSVQE